MALRKYRADAAVAASEAISTVTAAPACWICLALLLATVALAARIASFW